jgi:RNA polymerase sigma-70 factor (ECF subfamily)
MAPTGRNRSQFETAVRAYSSDLYRFAYWQCRDRFVAEDAVQETFARAWKAWHSLDDPAAAKSWLFTILRREIARVFERKPLDVDRDQDVDALAAPGRLSAPEGFEVREALAALPSDHRDALLLQVLGGFTCAEIGAIMAVSEIAATTRLSRARAALRRLMEPRPRARELRR